MWSGRKRPSQGTTLERLIALDCFDSPLGYMTEADWRAYQATFAKRAGIASGDSIFEVGCGGGAFLYPFYEQGHVVSGIDYSDDLIGIARSSMPERRDFLNAMEAASYPAEPLTDVVIANHVIHYFGSLEYAEGVITTMLKKAKMAAAVSGVPNVELKADSERERRGLLTPAEYEAKYRDLEILYYDKKWFTTIATQNGFAAEFLDHQMPGFAQNRFRFDCVMTRTAAS